SNLAVNITERYLQINAYRRFTVIDQLTDKIFVTSTACLSLQLLDFDVCCLAARRSLRAYRSRRPTPKHAANEKAHSDLHQYSNSQSYISHVAHISLGKWCVKVHRRRPKLHSAETSIS